MRRILAGLAAVATGIALMTATPAHGVPPVDVPIPAGPSDAEAGVDDLPNPAELKRRAMREAAVGGVLNGELTPVEINGSTVVNVGDTETAATADVNGRRVQPTESEDQYVELGREQTDQVFVILAEFGNQRDARYPDRDTNSRIPGPIRYDGPLHNQIPQPDRTVDNSTIWQPDYNREHYQEMYFGEGPDVESLKTYYEVQSSGRYSVTGTVSDWVQVPFNQARYGRSDGYPCPTNVCSNTWALVRDAANNWYDGQIAAGRSADDVRMELQQFDVWDRYDFDNDGNFNEPDGYLDHFQIVHAGGDQADGDPIYGEDAIWSHRWKAFYPDAGRTGPAGNLDGGTQIGNTGLWIADYTIQPENGGRSVFFHEFGHDLGLPDAYDTTGAGDNPVEYWSLMGQSRLGAEGEPFIGDRAGDLGAWAKLQLGWLDYEIVPAGQRRTLDLGPEEYNSDKAQAVVVPLPDKEVVTQLGAPYAGSRQWYSGSGNNLDNSMTRQLALPAGPATLSFQARWNIEDCGPDPCDYAYVEIDDGTGFRAIPGSITKPAEGNGIDGIMEPWTPATFDLSAYAGKTVGLRIRYLTDPAVLGQDETKLSGLFVDDIAVTSGGQVVFSDGAETPPNGWALVGFSSVAASVSNYFDNWYIAGYRTYISYDQYLQTGPYNFGFLNTRPDWVEHYPYQTGLLISYWDTSQNNNNVSQHPGEGRNLYIDARVRTLYRLDGAPWRVRVQMYDAPFSRTRADSFTLHVNSRPSYIRGQPGQPVFDDTSNWFDPNLPNHGVKVRNAGVRITVVSEDGPSARIRIAPS